MAIDASNLAERMDAKLLYFKERRNRKGTQDKESIHRDLKKELKTEIANEIIQQEIDTRVQVIKKEAMTVTQTLQARQEKVQNDVREMIEDVASVDSSEAAQFQIKNLENTLKESQKTQETLKAKFAESQQRLKEKKKEKTELQNSLQTYIMMQRRQPPSAHQSTIQQISRNLCTSANKEIAKNRE